MNRILWIIVLSLTFAAWSASAQQGAALPQDPTRPAPTNKPVQPRRADSIEGRISSDDGQPLIKVQVRLSRVGLIHSLSRAVGTDDEGRFIVDDLAPGTYSVSAIAPGYVLDNEEREPKYYRSGDTIDLTMTRGGVITGTVTQLTGEPVVAVRVQAVRVRDSEGRSLRRPASLGSQITDDRGVYRIYGLQPGSYLVLAGAPVGFAASFGTGYEEDVATYFPSATRDTAAEVTVGRGQEATSIDIRYRGERGRSVSGSVVGAVATDPLSGSVFLTLTHTASGFIEATTSIFQRNEKSFAFHGVPDGEYELTALNNLSSGESRASSPLRVIVKGADVTGLEVKLALLGSIVGRTVLEIPQGIGRKDRCKDDRKSLLEETVVLARRDENRERQIRQMNPAPSITGAPDSKGEFILPRMHAFRYRIETELPNKNWFIRAITLPDGGRDRRSIDVARNGLALKSGERVKDMTITIAEGAASLRGRVVPFTEDDRLPDRLRVHLIPVEPERADDPLRFAETAVQGDGAFVFANIAPGRYRLLALPVPDEEPIDHNPNPLAWDGESRASLRRRMESEGAEIDLQPCQHVTDNILRYRAPAPQNSGRTKKNL